MTLVNVKSKNGTIYVYESENYWDKEKKQSRSKRICVGKRDADGNIIYSKRLVHPAPERKKQGPVPTTEAKRLFCGATDLFDSIGDKLGIKADLKTCFPEQYKQILSLAYYLILEDRNPMSRFPKWERTHAHPFGKDIPSQRSSELFSSITEEEKTQFFRLQGKRRTDNEFWAYDTTSISSHSTALKQVRYGNNKDHEHLPQINLALLFGEESNLPFYYRKLAGNISDVKTVKNLLADMNQLGFSKVKLVMDRGFYSEENINSLYQNHLKFILAAKVSLVYVQKELDKVRDTMRTRSNYNSNYQLYSHTTTIDWDYSQDRPYKKDTLQDKKRMYLHIYYNSEKAIEKESNFNALLDQLEAELVSGKKKSEHEKQYAKYFKVHTTPVRGIQVTAKQEAIDKAEKDYGFFVLVSNEIKDPIRALEIYRNKDVVEKAFGNLKERLNLRRTSVSSDSALEGKLFVQFIALIYMSYIKKQMQTQNMFKTYTVQEVLDELDVIECFEQPGYERRIGEVTKKQASLFESLGVASYTSL